MLECSFGDDAVCDVITQPPASRLHFTHKPQTTTTMTANNLATSSHVKHSNTSTLTFGNAQQHKIPTFSSSFFSVSTPYLA